MILPSSPPKTFEHLMVQPAIHACDGSDGLPRVNVNSRSASPPIFSAFSNVPREKFFTVNAAKLWHIGAMAAVP